MHGSLVGSPRRSVHFRSNSVFDTASWSRLSAKSPLDKTYLQTAAHRSLIGFIHISKSYGLAAPQVHPHQEGEDPRL